MEKIVHTEPIAIGFTTAKTTPRKDINNNNSFTHHSFNMKYNLLALLQKEKKFLFKVIAFCLLVAGLALSNKTKSQAITFSNTGISYQNTAGTTTQNGFTLSTLLAGNGTNGYAGEDNQDNSAFLRLYANQSTGTIANTSTAFREFSTSTTAATPGRALVPGDRVWVRFYTISSYNNIYVPGNGATSGTSSTANLGISFNANTTFTNTTSQSTNQVCKFQLNTTGGWTVYSGSSLSVTNQNASAVPTNSATYYWIQLDVTSSTTFDATIYSSDGTTVPGSTYQKFCNLSFGATGPITSICFYNNEIGVSNPDLNVQAITVNGIPQTYNSAIPDFSAISLENKEGASSASGTIGGVISNGSDPTTNTTYTSTPVTMNGTGTVTLGSANTYTGPTKIASGTLQLGIANALPVSSAGAITLAGGTLSNGATTGNADGTVGSTTTTMGTLNLTANSIIALGTGTGAANSLQFAASGGVSWTSGKTLTITGWTGTAGATGSAGHIYIGTTNTGGTQLTSTQLSQIAFTGGYTGAIQLSTGEVVPQSSCTPPAATSPSASATPGFTGCDATVTFTASGLATGTYTVTYNVSGTNTVTTTTASMSFTTGSPGTGTFTTSALSTAGTSNVVNITAIALSSTPACQQALSVSTAAFGTSFLYAPPSGAYVIYNFTNSSLSDSSGNGFTAIAGSAATATTDRFGGSNNAFSFSGSNYYWSPALSFSTTQIAPYSESVWFKTSSTTGGLLLGLGNGQSISPGGYDHLLYMDNNGRLVFGCWTGSATVIASPNTYNNGQWHHAVATINSSYNLTLYVDGAQVSTYANTNSPQAWTTGYLIIGDCSLWGGVTPQGTYTTAISGPSQNGFNGYLDDITVYKSALTATQVSTLYGNTASATSTCAGSGATVTLSSYTLGTGTYTVYYNVSGTNTVSATSATMSNFTSGSPGTGTFTTSALSTVGASNVVNITGITGSGPCGGSSGFSSYSISTPAFSTTAPTVSAVGSTWTPTVTGQAANSGYIGQTITITGTNFSGVTAVSIGGVAATSYTVNSTTNITAVVPVTAASTYVTVTTSCGGTSATASGNAFTNLGYLANTGGAWATAGTWLGAQGVPPSATTSNVTIDANVTSTPTATVGTLNVLSGFTLTITSATTITVSTASTNAGTITDNGVLVLGAAYTNSSTLNVYGTLQLNTGGSIVTTAPTYETSSTLIYNLASMTAGTEWTSNATSGAGVPYNVTIGNGTNSAISFGSTANYYQLNGTLTIAASSSLTQSSNGSSALKFGVALTNNGTYNDNGRGTWYVGTGTGTISSSTALSLNYLVVDNSGNLQLNSNNITLDGNTSALQFLSSGGLDLDQNTLTFSPSATILLNASGVKTISSTGGTGTLAFATSGSNTITPTSGSLTTASNVTLTLGAELIIGGASALTVNGTLQLNSGSPGGYINSNAPVYGSSSTLIYNNGGSYGVGTEWTASATSEPGEPANVQIGNGASGSALNLGGGVYNMTGNLTFSANTGAALTSSGTLSIGGNWTNNTTNVANFNAGTPAGTVVFNGSGAQTISGSNTNTGGYDFNNLTINNSAGTSSGVTVSVPISTGTSGVLTLTKGLLNTSGSNTVTVKNTANTGVSGGSNSPAAYVNGPLTWDIANSSGTNYNFPVGATVSSTATYLPFTLNSPTGTSPVITVTAVGTAPSGGFDATLIGLGSEYWTATFTNTYTSGTVSLAQQTSLGVLNTIGRSSSSTGGGTFTSLGGTVSGDAINNSNATGSTLGSFCLAQNATPVITSVAGTTPSISGQATNTGYIGQTITISGASLGSATSVTVGGTGVTVVTNTSTAITFVLPAGVSGTVSVTTANGTGTQSGFSNLGYITTTTGDWNSTNTALWLGAAVPPSGATTTIDNAITVNGATAPSPNVVTILTGNSITFGASGALAVNTTLTNGGTITMSSGGTLTMAAGSTFTNNGTFTGGTGTVNFSGAGTVSGSNATTFNNLTINTGTLTLSTVPTINGTLLINGGNVSVAPIYGASSTLEYNTTYTRYVEWNAATAGTIGTTAGYPNNVIVNSGTLTLYNTGETTGAAMAGALTVGSGNTLTMGALTGPLVANGNVNLVGTLKLSTVSGGDIKTGGNWVFTAGGTFTDTGRAVFFIGGSQQTIGRSASGTLNFDYIVNSNTSGGIQLTAGTSININAVNGGNGLSWSSSTTNFDLNGNTLNLTANQSIGISGADNIINSNGTTAYVSVNTGTVSSVSGTGSLTFGTNVTVSLYGGFNFGAGLSTINGTLGMNANGYVNSNAPIYGTGSLLLYYSAANPFNRGLEWSAASGAGYPYNVEIGDNTTLNPGGSSNTGVALDVANNFTIDAGSSLFMDYGTPATTYSMTIPLIVNGNINISGGLSESNVSGGDVKVGGNWTRTGSFYPIGRAVYFIGTSGNQTITATGGESFAYLIIDNTTSGGGNVILANNITVANTLTFTKGLINTGTNKVLLTASTGSVSGAAQSTGWINGNEEINYATGSSVSATYSLGGPSYYSPLTLTLGTVGTAGDLLASVTEGSSLSVTGLNTNRTIKRYWSTTTTGVTGTAVSYSGSASASLAWNAADYSAFSPAIIPANLLVGVYNGSTWALATNSGTPTATTITTTASIATSTITNIEVGEACPGSGNVTAFSYAGSPYCSNAGTGSVTLTNNCGVTGVFSISDGLTINSSTGAITLSSAGTSPLNHTVTYSIAATGGCSAYAPTAPVTIDIVSAAPTSATAGSSAICSGGSTTLTLNGGGGGTGTGETIHWYTGSCGGTSVGTGNGISVNPSATTTYYGRYEDGAPCSFNTACATVTVTVNTPPSAATLSGTATICSGSSTNLSVAITGGTSPFSVVYTGGGGGTWPGYTSGTGEPVSPGTTTTYGLASVTDANGCTVATPGGSAVVTVNARPTSATLSGTATICTGSSTNLSVAIAGGTSPYSVVYTGAGGGTWTSYTSGTAEPVSPGSTTTYGLTSVTDFNGCTVASPGGSATVTVNAIPTISSQPSTAAQSVPVGGTATALSVTAGAGSGSISTYQWYSNGTNSNTGGTLVATHTTSATTDTYTPATTAATTQNICGSLTSAPLSGNTPSAGTGAWTITSGGSGTFSASTSGTSTFTAGSYGTYILTWTISNGPCAPSAANDTVTFYQSPSTATVGSTQTITGSLVSSSLGGNTPVYGSGQWNITSGGTGTFSNSTSGSSTFTANATGTYVLTWTISNGTCPVSSASVTVTFN